MMLSGSMNAADLGSDVATHSPMRTTLFDLLSNDLILLHTSPYLGATTIFSVASLSRSFRKLICSSPRVLNYLDLSEVRSLRRPQWYQSPQEHSDLITEDDYYARPLERALSALQPVFLQSVRTLILDRVNTSVRLLIDLLTNPAYQIRILSLQAVEGLTDGSLLQTLRYLVRSSRQHRSLKLKALYYFQVGSSSLVEKTFTDNTIIGEIEGITTKSGARLGAGNQGFSGTVLDDDPYARSAYKTHGVCPTFARDINWSDWASLLRACQELIAFDVVLCPRCCSEIASIRLAGCQSCGSCPEKPAYPSHCAMHRLPLLVPVPLHTTSVEAAQRLDFGLAEYPPLIVRCRTCLESRWCERCNAWWCETCYILPPKASAGSNTTLSAARGAGDVKGTRTACFDCRYLCSQCRLELRRICQACSGEYCIKHDDECTNQCCAWCARGAQRGAMLEY